MDRKQLEELRLPELKEELIKYNLPLQATKARCIDMLLSHFEKNVSIKIGDNQEFPRAITTEGFPSGSQIERSDEITSVSSKSVLGITSSFQPILDAHASFLPLTAPRRNR